MNFSKVIKRKDSNAGKENNMGDVNKGGYDLNAGREAEGNGFNFKKDRKAYF